MTSVDGDTRTLLIESGLTLLRDGGLEAVTLRAVGDLSNLSRSAPYRHFADKTALLAALAERVIMDLTGHVTRAVLKESSHEDRLRAYYTSYVDYAVTHPQEYRLVFAPEFLAGDHPGLEAAIDRATTAMGVDAKSAPFALTLGALLATAHGIAELVNRGHFAHKGIDVADVIKVIVASSA